VRVAPYHCLYAKKEVVALGLGNDLEFVEFVVVDDCLISEIEQFQAEDDFSGIGDHEGGGIQFENFFEFLGRQSRFTAQALSRSSEPGVARISATRNNFLRVFDLFGIAFEFFDIPQFRKVIEIAN